MVQYSIEFSQSIFFEASFNTFLAVTLFLTISMTAANAMIQLLWLILILLRFGIYLSTSSIVYT